MRRMLAIIAVVVSVAGPAAAQGRVHGAARADAEPAGGTAHPHHVGAEVGQDHGRVRDRADALKLHDAQSRQRSGACRPLHPLTFLTDR